MDIAAAQQFLRDNECAILATRRRDGGIQMSPITVGVDAEGHAIISSRETAYKVRNLRRDPWAALCVFVDEFLGPWVQVEGTAEVLSLPEYYRGISGEHPNWDEYRQAMERDRRVLIRLTIERAGPDRKG